MATVTQRERLFRGQVHSEHIVHFVDDDAARVKMIADFLAAALSKDASAVVIARRAYWPDVAARLVQRRIATSLDTRLVVLDAELTLAGLMRRGRVDHEAFESTVPPLVRSLAASSPAGLYAYGEMVDLLAAEGNFDGARELEESWNRLAAETPFTLLCGYSSAHFAAASTRDQLTAICGCHTKVRTDAADTLGQWIVGRTVPLSAAARTSSSAAPAAR